MELNDERGFKRKTFPLATRAKVFPTYYDEIQAKRSTLDITCGLLYIF